MGVRVALMVRPGRRMGPLPTGSIFLVAELAEGLTRRDLDAALAARTLEITDFPTDPEAVVGRAPEAELEPTPEPQPTPEPEVPPAPAAPAIAPKPSTTEKPRPAPEPPKVVTSPENAAALKAAVAEDKAVNLLAETHSKSELVRMAKRAGATFSERGSKEEIAREIVEAEAAKKGKRGH